MIVSLSVWILTEAGVLNMGFSHSLHILLITSAASGKVQKRKVLIEA